MTFSGDLTYTGDAPTSGTALSATLVGASDAGSQIADQKVTGVDYGSAVCPSLEDAVQRYSHLTGSSTYGEKSFELTQQTAFLYFTIAFEGGVVTDTDVDVTVENGGTTVRTGSVTSTTVDGRVVAQFVAAFPGGSTTLSDAKVTAAGSFIFSFGGTTALAPNKVYNISKTAKASAGMMYFEDGTFGSENPLGKTVIGVVAYVNNGGTDADAISEKSAGWGHGLVMALDEDASENLSWGDADREKAKDEDDSIFPNCYVYPGNAWKDYGGLAKTQALNSSSYPAFYVAANYTPKPSSTTNNSGWFLPSLGQWVAMMGPDGLGELTQTAIENISDGTYIDSYQHKALDKIQAALKAALNDDHAKGIEIQVYVNGYEQCYCTSSEYNEYCGIIISYNQYSSATTWRDMDKWITNKQRSKYAPMRVRPFLAF